MSLILIHNLKRIEKCLMNIVFSFCVILSLFAFAENKEPEMHLIQWNLKTPSTNVTDFN